MISGGRGPSFGSVQSRAHNAHGADVSMSRTVPSRPSSGESCLHARRAIYSLAGLLRFFPLFHTFVLPANEIKAAGDSIFATRIGVRTLGCLCPSHHCSEKVRWHGWLLPRFRTQSARRDKVWKEKKRDSTRPCQTSGLFKQTKGGGPFVCCSAVCFSSLLSQQTRGNQKTKRKCMFFFDSYAQNNESSPSYANAREGKKKRESTRLRFPRRPTCLVVCVTGFLSAAAVMAVVVQVSRDRYSICDRSRQRVGADIQGVGPP